jgi:TPP-dependent pyruvate/acetoin dehydrogenase alpha subunit
MSNRPNFAREILRLRLSQMLINERYKARDFRVPIHLALGHEALAVAVADTMREKDQILLSHRNLHYNLARCRSLKAVIDEFLLRDSGLARGKYGSMNLINPDAGLIYSSCILGNNLGVATGVALAEKVSRTGAVTFVVTGDGAMEEGAFYESLILMRSQSLSCIVIVENNEWSLASRISERRASIDLASLAGSCGAGYLRLAGNDVISYADELAGARRAAASETRPVVVEVELKTLGDWRQSTDEFPDGKYINYHAGPAPTVNVMAWPLLAEGKDDPLHVLLAQTPEVDLRREAESVLAELQRELA